MFEKYPEIATEIKNDCYYNYQKNIMQKMLNYRNEHLEQVNKASSYKTINIQQRDDLAMNDALDSEMALLSSASVNDLNLVLQRKLGVIQEEMNKLGR